MCDWPTCVCGATHSSVLPGPSAHNPVCYETGHPTGGGPVTSYVFVQAQAPLVKAPRKAHTRRGYHIPTTIDEDNNPKFVVTPGAASVLSLLRELATVHKPHALWYSKDTPLGADMAMWLCIKLGIPCQDPGALRMYPPGADRRDRMVVVVIPRCPLLGAGVVDRCTFV